MKIGPVTRIALACLALCAVAAAVSAAQLGPRNSLEGVVYVPPVIVPGEELELAVQDPRLTPSGGRWEIGGVAALETGGRLRVRLPATLSPGQPLEVTYRDPAGALRVQARAPVHLATAAEATPPRITDCTEHAVAGDVVCVCGSFPPAAWDGLTIDGHPAGERVAASRRVVLVRLPPGLAPGPHVIGGDPAYGFGVRDRVLVTALRVASGIEREELVRGQAAALHVTVQGTEEPLPVRFVNASPRIVSLEGGEEQGATTSGGVPNRVQRRVRARQRGGFRIGYELAPSPCPCLAEPDQARTPFLPGRALALVSGADPGRLPQRARALAATHGLSVLEVHPLPSMGEGLIVFAATDVPLAVATLRRDPRVILAQPDFVHSTAAGQGALASAGDYARQLIGAHRLPAEANGQGVSVALVDTGVDSAHRALTAAIADQVDVSGRGLTPDVHGTLLAGIIAAQGDGASSPRGLAPRARLLVIKACHPDSPRAIHASCTSTWLARGLDAAAQREARVVNLSVAGRSDELVSRLVAGAVRAGRMVVAAAGHEDEADTPFPAALEGVLAVTAVGAARERYAPATRGDFVDLAAPGIDVMSTAPRNQAALFSGTSAATAFVAGAAALLLQARPQEGAARVHQVLERTAQDLGPPGKDAQFGSGLLDVCRAVRDDADACR